MRKSSAIGPGDAGTFAVRSKSSAAPQRSRGQQANEHDDDSDPPMKAPPPPGMGKLVDKSA